MLTFDAEGRESESSRPLHMHQWLDGIADLAPSMPPSNESTWLKYYSQLVDRGLISLKSQSKAHAKQTSLRSKSLSIRGNSHTLLPVSLASVFMLHMMCTNADTVGLPTYESHAEGMECFLLPVPPEDARDITDQELFVSVSEDVDVMLG